MAYQVIARKWRPQTFEDVTGQEAITRTLQNAIENQRLHHAYLFSGARGVGKTTTARLLAKALNCIKGPTIEPCNVCASCIEIASGTAIDVHEIDAASNTGVDNVREAIINSLNIAPDRDKYKIFIIDEVHMLSSNSFNALLKTMEEPPSHVIFIMATTELHKVPDTILSRCQQFEFKIIPAQKIFNRLKLIANAEEVAISDIGLNLIVRAGEGDMRDAQSAFDQVISFAGKEIKDSDVGSALGIIGPQTLNAFVDAIANRDVKSVLSLVDDLVSRGYDLRNFTKEMMAHFRNLLVIRAVGFDKEIVSATDAEAAELKRLSDYFSEEDLVRFFNVLTKVEQDIKNSTQERFQLELGLLKLTQMAKLSSLEELLERIKRLEGSSSGGGSIGSTRPAPPSRIAKPEPSRVSSRPSQPEPPRPPAKTLTEELLLEPPQLLDEPYEAISGVPTTIAGNSDIEKIKALLESRKKMRVLVAIDSAEDIQITEDQIRFTFGAKGKVLAENLGSRDSIKLLEEVASEATGRKLSVVITGAAGIALAAAKPKGNGSAIEPSSEKSSRQRANDHPVVQSFVKAFRGQIVDVRTPDDSE